MSFQHNPMTDLFFKLTFDYTDKAKSVYSKVFNMAENNSNLPVEQAAEI